jgi:hypothetical protein
MMVAVIRAARIDGGLFMIIFSKSYICVLTARLRRVAAFVLLLLHRLCIVTGALLQNVLAHLAYGINPNVAGGVFGIPADGLQSRGPGGLASRFGDFVAEEDEPSAFSFGLLNKSLGLLEIQTI